MALVAWRQRRSHWADLLAEVYAWCTEGFDPADLQEAKAWLEELASRSIRLHLGLDQLTPASFIQPSLDWHEGRSALVLDQDHQEFRRLGTAGVPVHDMHIVGAFIEGLSRR
jgi:hypothetical protein